MMYHGEISVRLSMLEILRVYGLEQLELTAELNPTHTGQPHCKAFTTNSNRRP